MSEAVKQIEIESIGFNWMFFAKEPNEEPELSALREASTGEVSLIFAVDSTGIWALALTCGVFFFFFSGIIRPFVRCQSLSPYLDSHNHLYH